MIRRSVVSPLVLAAVALIPVPLLAQAPPAGQRGGGRGAAAAPQNLQVLPKETTQAQVLQTMQAFTAGLGVQCGYCHVQTAAPDGGRGGGGGRGRGPAA